MATAATGFDRQYVSLYSVKDFTLQVYIGGVLADADLNAVSLDFVQTDVDPPVVKLNHVNATHDSTGEYRYTFNSTDLDVTGNYEIRWSFATNGTPQIAVTYVEVGEPAPAYDALSDDYKGIVDNVWSNFADMFDSPLGGPYVQTQFQSNFGRGRVAGLLANAFDDINFGMQPNTNFGIPNMLMPGQTAFPTPMWGGLVRQALFVEVIKHLIRSYVEQPDPQFVNVAWLNRRDYMQRWQSVLEQELKDFQAILEQFKISLMMKSRVMVSGGVYGTYGPTRGPINPAWPRYFTRFFG